MWGGTTGGNLTGFEFCADVLVYVAEAHAPQMEATSCQIADRFVAPGVIFANTKYTEARSAV